MTDFSVALHGQLSLRERKRPLGTGVETIYSRKQIEQAFLETFELVGGVPRLALWANDPENYGTFLKLLMTMAPKEQAERMKGQILEYRSAVPQSPLNRGPEDGIQDAEFTDG